MRRPALRWLPIFGLALCTNAAWAASLPRDVPAIAAREQRQKASFTDSDIVDGFMQIAFGAEYHLAGRIDRIRKYDKPVRVFVENRVRRDRKAQLEFVVGDIAKRVANLDIAMTESREDASVVVRLVRDRDMRRTISSVYGKVRGREIQTSLDPQCLSGFRKDDQFAIIASDVIIAADKGDFTFFDCAYEELLQSLGPINDSDTLPWTMFNDNVSMGFFDIYDQYILNLLYHPRIRPGMTAPDVLAIMPEILPEVRAWVAKAKAPDN